MLYAEQLHRELLAAQASCIVTWHCFLVMIELDFCFWSCSMTFVLHVQQWALPSIVHVHNMCY